jgi:hypothetical protein
MTRLWYIEEPGKYDHSHGNSLAMYKFESSAKIALEKLKAIPSNETRTLVINHYDEPASKFPEWSWVWNTSEKEENKIARGE